MASIRDVVAKARLSAKALFTPTHADRALKRAKRASQAPQKDFEFLKRGDLHVVVVDLYLKIIGGDLLRGDDLVDDVDEVNPGRKSGKAHVSVNVDDEIV